MGEPVTYRLSSGIAVVTIDNPPMNALSEQVKHALEAVFGELNARIEEVKVVILTGAGGKVFVAGADIKELPGLNPQKARARFRRSRQLFLNIERFDRPVICAIDGLCLGGGLELAMCCDIRIATEKSTFGQPEINLGILPGGGGTQRLPRLVGMGIAKELIFTGRLIKAEEARNIGLVNGVVPSGEHMKKAEEIAQVLCEKAPLALRAAKEVIGRGMNMTLENGLILEADLGSFLYGTEDQKEGALAFLEKRKPGFKGK